MFFVKAAFWIFLILLLMPTNDKDKSDFYIAAGRTLSDLGGFCTRNPDVCDKTGTLFDAIVRKLRNTTQMIEDLVREVGADSQPDSFQPDPMNEPRRREGAQGDARIAPAASNSQHTLEPIDFQPTWRGPGRV